MTNIEKILAFVAIAVLIGVISLPIYDYFGRGNVTVIVQLDDASDPFKAIPRLLPGEAIVKVEQINRNNNEYQIIVASHKNKQDLLDKILKNHHVKKARLE